MCLRWPMLENFFCNSSLILWQNKLERLSEVVRLIFECKATTYSCEETTRSLKILESVENIFQVANALAYFAHVNGEEKCIG